jgi:sugar lactone lactonase YvrE
MKRYYLFAIILFFTSQTEAQEKILHSSDLLSEWTFTRGIEGPAVDATGNLYAVNFAEQGTIGVVTPDGVASLFVKLPAGSVGNGIRFDKGGFMYIADYPRHNILKVDPSTKEISVFAHEPAMNQPNDIAISPVSEILYASDPAWRDSTGKLWMIDRTGKVTLLEENMGTTNGIEVSPDGKRLYVNESIQRVVWVYKIRKDGSIGNKKIFKKFSDYGMDGMRCDSKGNLYITRHGKGTIALFSPDGKLIKEFILKGKLCSNIVLSRDEKLAFITMADRGMFEIIEIKSFTK